MDFLGKRIYRVRLPKQIGLDPEMAVIIHRRAENKGRSIEREIIWLLTEGIKNDSEVFANEYSAGAYQPPAQGSTQPHMAAPKRAPRHTNAQKQGVA